MSLFYGDCQKLLKEIPDESVDLIITSPPYCMKKAYEDPHADIGTFKNIHLRIFDDIYRVLKPGGNRISCCKFGNNSIGFFSI